MEFCDAKLDDTPRLGVIGIISADSHADHRAAIRATWLNSGGEELLARFVLRGINAASATLEEARTHGDVVLVRGEAQMRRSDGPLLSLLLWLRCATRAWPRAQHIGKADDDVWLHLRGVASHLVAAHAALPPQHQQLYWGLMESYHWELSSHRPQGFAFKFAGQRCNQFHRAYNRTVAGARARRKAVESGVASYVGPFAFARGPLYFVPAAAAAQLATSARLADDFEATLASTKLAAPKSNGTNAAAAAAAAAGAFVKSGKAWEDVYTGYALTRFVETAGLAAVHAGAAIYGEGWQSGSLTSQTLIWHSGPYTKAAALVPARIRVVHALASAAHCDTPSPLQLHRCAAFTSCSGREWRRCLAVYNKSACPAVKLALPKISLRNLTRTRLNGGGGGCRDGSAVGSAEPCTTRFA